MNISGKTSPAKCLVLCLGVMALVVTGCPYNDYTVQLKPQGNGIERTLIFYRADGVNTNNSAPNYQAFEADEVAAISALYPAAGVTNDGGRYVVRGEFNDILPGDVGGAGAYTNLTTSLGSAGFYVERFRGNDDLAGMTERRFQAADQLADLLAGWSRAELGREPGYDRLHRFLELDLRRDLKNLSAYWWEVQLVNSYKTNSSEEFVVRFGQYLLERGYFSLGELPGLFRDVSGDDSPAWQRRIQRLVARKMGVSEADPVPGSLAFLGSEDGMEKSLTNYLATTEAYRARLKQWEEEQKTDPESKRPDPKEVVTKAAENLIEFNLFVTADHLAVRLSLPAPPLHGNGRWDDELKQVTWETDLGGRTNATHLPYSCYASWAQADVGFQKDHLGKVALAGDELVQYCLWRSSQVPERGREWDAFLAGLEPGPGLKAKLDTFRFSGEMERSETNRQQNLSTPSAWPRELLNAALK